MNFFYDYLIKIDCEYKDTFQTKGGLVLYANKKFSRDLLSNRHAEIVSTPIKYEGKILPVGTKILIDNSVYNHIEYDNNRYELTTETIDRKEGLYIINPTCIIAYYDEVNKKWEGYANNFVVRFYKEEIETTNSFGIITSIKDNYKNEGFCEVVYTNDFLKYNGVSEGDRIYAKPTWGIPIYIDNEELFWIRDEEVLCKVE